MRSVVVLPQPDGPSSVHSVPGLDVERHVVDRRDVAVALGHVLEHDALDALSRMSRVCRRGGDRGAPPEARFADELAQHEQDREHEEDQRRRVRDRERYSPASTRLMM